MNAEFAAIPQVVLGPLADRPEAHWYKAPPGKWCPAQIVHHVAIGIDRSGRTFQERRDKPPMRRRPRTAIQLLGDLVMLKIGWIPSGFRAPDGTRPADRPAIAEVEQMLREGVARFLALERELLPARETDLFVKHPRLGDLTLPEWLRFHVRHCAHHARQIRARVVA